MKKIILALLSALCLLVGCSSTDGGGVAGRTEVDRNFTKVHIQLSENTLAHRDVISYRYETQESEMVYLNLKGYGWTVIGLKNIVLYNGSTCPVCRY